jgi:hypothetical protein
MQENIEDEGRTIVRVGVFEGDGVLVRVNVRLGVKVLLGVKVMEGVKVVDGMLVLVGLLKGRVFVVCTVKVGCSAAGGDCSVRPSRSVSRMQFEMSNTTKPPAKRPPIIRSHLPDRELVFWIIRSSISELHHIRYICKITHFAGSTRKL